MTQAKLDKLCSVWARRLRLQDWIVSVSLIEEFNPENFGRIEIDPLTMREGRSERSENIVPMREPAPFVPPRVKRGMGTEEEPATTAEIINRAENMDLKDLQKLLMASGHLKSEHI